jgi:hypothetical protein
MIAQCTFHGSHVKRGWPRQMARWGWLGRGARKDARMTKG